MEHDITGETKYALCPLIFETLHSLILTLNHPTGGHTGKLVDKNVALICAANANLQTKRKNCCDH